MNELQQRTQILIMGGNHLYVIVPPKRFENLRSFGKGFGKGFLAVVIISFLVSIIVGLLALIF